MKSVMEVYSEIAKTYKPWTKEEEEEAIKKWFKKDNEKFIGEAVKHNLNLVFSIMNKVAFNKNNEDIFQRALMALVDALKKYDPKKGYKISTWLTNPIRWSILQSQTAYSNCGTISEELAALNHRHGLKYSSVSIDSPVGSGDESSDDTIGNIISIKNVNVDYATVHTIQTIDEDIHNRDIESGISSLLDKMNEFLNMNEMIVIRGILNGQNLSDIAKEMNLSRMRLSQISRKAFEKIRNSPIGNKLKGLL